MTFIGKIGCAKYGQQILAAISFERRVTALFQRARNRLLNGPRTTRDREHRRDVLNLTRSYSDVLIRLHLRVAFAFGHCTMVSGTMLAGLGPAGFHAYGTQLRS